jgi:hypothetical protein
MNLHRFLAYAVLACWIGLTAVTVGTALQWSAARTASEVKIQRALTAQKEASASPPSQAQQDLPAAPEERAETAALQRNHDRALFKAEDATDAMAEAINLEAVTRNQFWWEFAVWGGMTLLTSTLLAERTESEETASAHKEESSERLQTSAFRERVMVNHRVRR